MQPVKASHAFLAGYLLGCLALSPLPLAAQATEAGEATAGANEGSGESRFVETHGFVSQGFILTSGNNFLAKAKHGSFEFSEVGINLTKNVTDRLRLGIQLFARDLGPVGNYNAKFDWYYLDYRISDWFGLRAGRTKLPFGLYNEVNDVDAGRVSVLLPQSVYPLDNRDILLAQTGVEAYGYVRIGAGGALEYRLYGGTIFATGEPPPDPVRLTGVDVPYVVGGRVMWDVPPGGLRAGFSLQDLRVDSGYTLAPGAPPLFSGVATLEFTVLLWMASLEYTSGQLTLAAEYGHWRGEVDSNQPAIIQPVIVVNERYYVSAAYQLAPWLTTGVYYAGLYPNHEQREGRAASRHDVAATVRFDLTEHWLLKLEGHFLHGTADLKPALNDGIPQDKLQKNWTAFFAKTTAYF